MRPRHCKSEAGESHVEAPVVNRIFHLARRPGDQKSSPKVKWLFALAVVKPTIGTGFMSGVGMQYVHSFQLHG